MSKVTMREFKLRGLEPVLAFQPDSLSDCEALDVEGEWNPGAWVVKNSDGTYSFVDHDVFTEMYEPVN